MTEAHYLLDSNICVYLLEATSEPLRQRIAACNAGELVTSAIVYAEVGMKIDHDEPLVSDAFEKFFVTFPIVTFDSAAARAYWSLPFRRGRFDRLIAAQALSAGLTVITANVADFADVPGLKVEDWTR